MIKLTKMIAQSTWWEGSPESGLNSKRVVLRVWKTDEAGVKEVAVHTQYRDHTTGADRGCGGGDYHCPAYGKPFTVEILTAALAAYSKRCQREGVAA